MIQLKSDTSCEERDISIDSDSMEIYETQENTIRTITYLDAEKHRVILQKDIKQGKSKSLKMLIYH